MLYHVYGNIVYIDGFFMAITTIDIDIILLIFGGKLGIGPCNSV
jgi:hypothetical protein